VADARELDAMFDELEDGESMALFTVCRWCGIGKPIEIRKEAWKAWRSGEHIQDVAPEISAGDRELLITQTCGPCFESMFAE